MSRRSDESRRLTDKASKGFDIADSYEKAAEQVRGMDRDEAVNCNEDALIKEEQNARYYLNSTHTTEDAAAIGESTTEEGNWSMFKDGDDE